jgi:hypothetical protein
MPLDNQIILTVSKDAFYITLCQVFNKSRTWSTFQAVFKISSSTFKAGIFAVLAVSVVPSSKQN